MRSTLIIFLFTVAAAWPARSFAEAPEVEARRHFEEGSKAYALGEFQRAITEYRAAFNAKPDPVILYNIAQAYRLGGDLQQAVFFYRSYLRQQPKAGNRKEVDKRIHDLDAQLQQHRALTTQPPNDAVPVGKLPPATPESEPLLAPEPQSKPVEIAPAPPVVESNLALTATPPPAQPAYKKWWVWTIVGVAAAGVAVGLGVGLTAGGTAPPPSSHFGDSHVF